MNQTLVTNVLGKNVYLINNQNLSFYISTPSSNKANIVLNLVDNVNQISMNNNMEGITREIEKIYSKFNYSDIAVITPIFDSNVLEQLKLNNNKEIFLQIDKLMGVLINSAYKVLTANHIEVDSKIKLNNNPSYNVFNSWFTQRYAGRIELVEYNIAPVNKFNNVPNPTLVNSEASAIANSVLDNTQTITTSSQSTPEEQTTISEPGFISYILLGVIVAVVSLVLLYMLL